MPAALISIIGPPACGKTTLAERLAEELPGRLIYEDYAGNPFLAQSYAGNGQARLPAQLHFLMSRVGQLSTITWPAEGVLISDYGFCQDRIFASLKLAPDELALYDQLALRLAGLVRRPDVLVHLDAAEDVLLARIAARGRGFERAISREFLRDIRAAYRRAAAEAAGRCAVIELDSGALDLREGRARRPLVERVRESLASRRPSE